MAHEEKLPRGFASFNQMLLVRKCYMWLVLKLMRHKDIAASYASRPISTSPKHSRKLLATSASNAANACTVYTPVQYKLRIAFNRSPHPLPTARRTENSRERTSSSGTPGKATMSTPNC